MLLPATLLARTALTLAVSLMVLFLFSIAVMFYFVMGPMAQQAAEDAAALMVLSAQTWAELPPDTRADFEDELLLSHGIKLKISDTPLQETTHWQPHMRLLQRALEERLYGQPVRIGFDGKDDDLFWVEFEVAERNLRLGVPRHRITPQMPFALLWLASGGVLVLLITSLIMVRRLTLPLERLSEAARRFGRGEKPGVLREDGPLELKTLAHSFNEMMRQIEELLANRTTLLAGISHDLRTPIARLTLAIELLPQKADPELVQRMRHDLSEMDALITRTLQLARNLDDAGQDREMVDLQSFLDALLAEYGESGTIIRNLQRGCVIAANPTALKRVVVNLLENALRYGEGKPVEVQLHCNKEAAVIAILDRGRGIPADKLGDVFQPFFRLEASRNQATGGSGLGLAIVQQLCHAQGWAITLQARNGGGLVAELKIPQVTDGSDALAGG
jgi:two-component system osmolarity sensor histidine kinase EnvZ